MHVSAAPFQALGDRLTTRLDFPSRPAMLQAAADDVRALMAIAAPGDVVLLAPGPDAVLHAHLESALPAGVAVWDPVRYAESGPPAAFQCWLDVFAPAWQDAGAVLEAICGKAGRAVRWYGSRRDEARPALDRVLAYEGGPLAISAVPGAGKTHMLTELAARLVAERGAAASEILILTYMREAARQVRDRVEGALASRGCAAGGLTVTTIHAFCLSLLAGAGEAPPTLSDAERRGIMADALERHLDDPHARRAWELANPPGSGWWDDPRRQTIDAALQALSAAKLHGLSPEALDRALAAGPHPELPPMVAHYEAARTARGALDFDDHVRLALARLEQDPAMRAALRDRYRFILEDEAQDSTPAQHRLLELLAGPGGNLVRVGDPNQAITATFTAADPRYFRAFCEQQQAADRHVAIATSSRSGRPVLAVANHLVAIAAHHPDPAIAEALAPIAIAPAGRLNPPDAACSAAFHAYQTADHERLGVLSQVRRHLARHPADRVAVLVPTNREVATYQDFFTRAGLPVGEDEASHDDGPIRLLTLHRAKGAEFDAVWLPQLGCQPAGREGAVSAFPWEPEQVNLFGLKGLLARAAVLGAAQGMPLEEKAVLAAARREAIAERLRLLYVGLTRGRRHLTLSCHTHGGKIPPPWHIQALAGRCS